MSAGRIGPPHVRRTSARPAILPIRRESHRPARPRQSIYMRRLMLLTGCRARINQRVAGSSPWKNPLAGLQRARAREFDKCHTRSPNEIRTRDASEESLTSDFVTTHRRAITCAALSADSLSEQSAHCYEECSSRGAITNSRHSLDLEYPSASDGVAQKALQFR